MKKFVIKTVVFASILLVGVSLLLIMPYSPKTNKKMFIEKTKDSLLDNVKSPRIIFIGGSNISLGLNSQLIKDSLQLNPINNAIHAGIGLKYMLRSSIDYIKTGDIVIVIPEYHQFYGHAADGQIVLLPLLFEVSYKFKYIDFKQYMELSQYIPKYIASKLKFWNDFKSDEIVKNDLSGVQSYNKYGDIFKHWTLPKPDTFVKYVINDDLNTETFDLLAEFKTKVENKNAYLFISYPCYAESSFDQSYSQISIIENKFKELQLDILGTPNRYRFNDSLIFNTAYHLTKEGVDLRTQLLIEDLQNHKHGTFYLSRDRESSKY